MKRYLYILFVMFFVIPFSIRAQENQYDVIQLLNGESLRVKVTIITERSVTFNYPGESISYTKSKNNIQDIFYASGRREKVNEKINVQDEKDWMKVIITNIPEDVEGLSKRGDLKVKSTATTVFTGAAKIDEKATNKLKKQAARLGAHIVYVQSETNDRGLRNVNRSIKSGTAYSYN
ncbi:hypothetical protein QQ008_27250 [Fulvivirgaceae bacterium BMA10]|uniref:Uncharacterized protein n=1 Tax=Splendidivirga corallicola TaxID=3051826 RepID=A0ABT8KWG1_9BACT|nr:hypothetical protein [Fulvivirgaceae bacterium BMA10]